MAQTSKCALLLLGLLTLQLAGLTVSQTIPEGDPNFVTKAEYQKRCAAALDGSKGFTSATVRAAPGGQIFASNVDSKYKNGCRSVRVTEDDEDVTKLSTEEGPKLDRANFDKLYQSGAARFTLTQAQTNCLRQFNLNIGTAEIYTGRNLKSLGDRGVQTLNGGLHEADIVVGAPNAGTNDPAVVTIGKNIFLAAGESALNSKLKPVPGTAQSQKSQVDAFVNDPATRAQLALLHGLWLVDDYARTSAGNAAGFSRNLWSTFSSVISGKNCIYGDLPNVKNAYQATYGNAGKYLCCLKEQQFSTSG